MSNKTNQNTISNTYLATLEKVKKQYQQYIEVSRLYDVTKLVEPKPEENQDRLITTNSTLHKK